MLTSRRYLHGVITDLIEDSLLRSVREEILEHLSFSPKETDIYKIHQSGDLANLDGLDDDSLKLLPSLLTLRDALYSSSFREYLSTVTGSGPLSGTKTDMAINVYTPGCHLLCHDDVIGSRRVSYILYLTDPVYPWVRQWGGSLRLYPTKKYKRQDGATIKVPSPDYAKAIPPAWNQLSFFAVQPGESFHDVEEVFASKDPKRNKQRVRMAISGWYHIPQEGEDGYQEGLEEQLAAESSLTQLQSKDDEHDLPKANPMTYADVTGQDSNGSNVATARVVSSGPVTPNTGNGTHDAHSQTEPEEDSLTEPEIDFLLKFLSPTYLVPDTIEELNTSFNDASSLRIDKFLNDKYAESVRAFIMSQPDTLSSKTSKIEFQTGWTVARPPHKHRYLFMLPTDPDPNNQNLLAFKKKPVSPVKEMMTTLLPSLAFRKWLHLVTDLNISSHDIRARRYRRGNDYSLATAYEEEEPRLELTLGVTPTDGWEEDEEEEEEEEEVEEEDVSDNSDTAEEGPVPVLADAAKDKISEVNEADNNGASEDENEAEQQEEQDENDSGSHEKNPSTTPENEPGDNVGGYEAYMSSDPLPSAPNSFSDPAVYQSATAGEDEDDSVLFSMAAGWNRLSLVLRDKGVMRFVKYVSARAEGDRWDVVGEYAVEGDGDDEDDEEGDGGNGDGDGEGGEGEGEGGERRIEDDDDDDDDDSTDLAEPVEARLRSHPDSDSGSD